MRKRTKTPPVAQDPQPVVLEKLLTVKDVAALLQVSVVMVYQLMSYRGLPSFKIKGARRFESAALLKWIEQQKAA